MKARPAAGVGLTIDEAMTRVVEIPDRPALLAYLAEHYPFWQPTDANVTIAPYRYDARIGWDTWLVCIDGHAALFTDGPLPSDEPLEHEPDCPFHGRGGRGRCSYCEDQ